MNRPSRVQAYMDLAHTIAKRSTCMRLNVGAVIVHNRNPIAFGYNGAPPGAPHCAGNSCPGKEFCNETIHAEENALARWMEAGQPSPIDIFCTDSPCPKCVKQIAIISGDHRHQAASDRTVPDVQRVFFSYPYRLTDQLHQLRFHGIQVYRVLPAGYIMDWFTRELVEIEL